MVYSHERRIERYLLSALPPRSRKTGHQPWTDREDALIVQLRAKRVPGPEIAERLPHRTMGAVLRRIQLLREGGQLETVEPRWTKREDDLVCRWRERDDDISVLMAKLPHRTEQAISRRVDTLVARGRLESARVTWTDEDDARLCELRKDPEKPLDQIAQAFPDRTPAAVAMRTRILMRQGRIQPRRIDNAYRPWTQREEQLLLRLRGANATLDEIARRLHPRSRQAISKRINEMIEVGILERTTNSPKSNRPWSPEEDELVAVWRKANRTTKEMAADLNRSVPSVAARIDQRVRKGELELLRPRKRQRA